MASNCYHVQKKQWNKWNATQRAVFNRVVSALRYSDSVIAGLPERKAIPERSWNILRRNIAWLVASDVAHDLTFVTDKKDWNLNGTAPVKPS